MAETSLARQLKKLQAPQTSILKDVKSRDSFLFDPKEAATLDAETAYAIGATGLEELVAVNEKFSGFEQNLFSEASKFLERAVKTKEQNRELDETIEEFLLLLSPYFLLKPSHKALEWLVYRFRIHMYNVDAFLGCILPFHETRYFARAVQLLDLSDGASKWHWLKPLQKPGIPLPKTTLLNHCWKDMGFLKFVCNLLVSQVETHESSSTALRPVMGFYVSSVVGALEFADKVKNKMIATLLPYILRGLNSDMSDYMAATYMILSQLARRAVLEKEFLKEVVIRLVKTLKPECYTGGLLCLLVIVSYQVTALPKRAFQNLVKQHEAIVTSLEEISERHSVLPLIRLLLPRLICSALAINDTEIKSSSKSEVELFRTLVPLAHGTKDGIRFVVECFFENYVALYKTQMEGEEHTSDAALVEGAVELLKSLWQRAPEHVDACLEKWLCSEDNDAKQAILELTQLNILGAEHVPLAESGEALFLALNSPSKRTRIEAVEVLVKMILREEDLKDEFVKESLHRRLHDEDADVVEAVFSLGEELCRFVEPEVILALLRDHPLRKNESKKKVNLCCAILSFLCNCIYEMLPSQELLKLVLSHLLPTSSRTCSLVKCVLTSKGAQSLTIVTHLLNTPNTSRVRQLLNDGKFEEFINLALVGMATAAAAMPDMEQFVPELISISLSSGPNEAPQLKCITAYLLAELLSNIRGSEVFMQTLDFYRHILREKTYREKSAETSDNVQELVISLQEGKVPENLIVTGMGKLIGNVQPLVLLEEHIGWNPKIMQRHRPELELLACIFGTLADESNSKGKRREAYRELLQNFLEDLLPGLKQQLHFLLTLHALELTTLDKSSAKTQKLHSQGLAVAARLLEMSEGAKLNWLLAEQSTAFLSLLLPLLSPVEELRKLAVSAIQNALRASTSTKAGFATLANALLKNSAELTTDCDLLPGVVAKWHKSLRKPSGLLTLLAHSDTPIYVQVGILRLYSAVYSKDMLDVAVLLLNRLLDENGKDQLDDLAAEVAQHCFLKFTDEGSVPSLSAVDGAAEVLERALRSSNRCRGHDSVAVMALKMVDKHLVGRLPSDRRTSLMETLVELALTSVEPEHKAVMRALRKVCSVGSLVAEQLQKSETKSSVKTVKEAKRMRLTGTSESDPLDSPYWRRVLVVLEVLQGKKTVDSIDLLVAPLYSLLKRSFELGNFPGVEYLRQSVLSCLHGHQLAAPRHEVSLLVKCLRLAHSPHTQQLVLSLLNLSAAQCPEEVLHNVTSVFTFMGASLLRQDDNYSFQVVVQTVETVVPALLQACRKEPSEGQASDDAVSQVTRVFVDAYEDIPEHRRLPIFVKLVSTLGPTEFLWILLAQMVEHSTCKLLPDVDDQLSSAPSAILDFGLSLCSSFQVSVQMSTCIRLLEFIASLPSVKEKCKVSPKHLQIFNIEQRSEKQLQWFRLTATSLVSNLLCSANFLGQVAELQHAGDGSVETLYQECLSTSLQYLQQVTRWTHLHAPASCAKTWKVVLTKLHEIVNKVNGLLPSAQFISVVKSLMKHELPSLRRNAMDMLNAKLLTKDYFSSDDNESLLSVVRSLTHTSLGKLKFSDEVTTTLSEEVVVLNRQTALLSLKLLIRNLGSEYPTNFAKVYDMLVKLMTAEDIHPTLLSSSLLCLAEVCHAMPVQTIPHLSRLMPPFLNILQDKDRPETVTLGLVTTLHRVVECLSPFLSLYLAVIIREVCLLCAAHCVETSSQPTTVHQRLSTVCKQIGQLVEVRVLIPTVEDAFKSLPSAACVQHLMVILSSMTASAKDSELQGHFQQLQNLVLLLLDYRQQHKDLPSEVLCVAETHVVNTVTALCFKLSEETFRPFFCKIFSWATISEDKSERDRVFTFYHLTEKLSETLKGLFVLFAGQFIKHSATVLDMNHDRKRESPYFDDDAMCCQLLRHVLNTLASCFQHKGKTFLVRERTTILIEPLTDQIDNMLGDREEAVHSRITDCVVPCLAYFAVGCDDAARKEYHQKLLVKMRSSSAKVRYAALQVFRETVRKLGDDYLVLLPEAVPFLAELMEDDSTEVEQLCQEVILEVEQILGEPLMKYF
ncbi:HEAT repeat-containing protein 1-like [Ornithodoros turicata]|uniref:HEAT repeat-containing protein 1-like n=1 Tax=Ornithodoros turicata TaxID=34597 RepID=UPI003139C23F